MDVCAHVTILMHINVYLCVLYLFWLHDGNISVLSYIHKSPPFLSTMTLQCPVGNSLNLAKTLRDEGIKF